MLLLVGGAGRGKVVRVMVLGVPNVGKSTFINKVAHRKTAKAEDRPGVTKTFEFALTLYLYNVFFYFLSFYFLFFYLSGICFLFFSYALIFEC